MSKGSGSSLFGSSKISLKDMDKLNQQANIRDFFDLFKRPKQKARLSGQFPSMQQLKRLEVYKLLLQGGLGDKCKNNDLLNLDYKMIDSTINNTLEYSISIDAAGRKEFIKSHIPVKETSLEEEEAKEKDIIDKIVNAVD